MIHLINLLEEHYIVLLACSLARLLSLRLFCMFEKMIFSKVKFLEFPMPSIAKNQHDSYFFLGPEILGIQGTFLAVGKSRSNLYYKNKHNSLGLTKLIIFTKQLRLHIE